MQPLVDVAAIKVVMGLEDRIGRLAGGQEPEQPRHRKPQPVDTRLAGAVVACSGGIPRLLIDSTFP